jgi:hypothetical protein
VLALIRYKTLKAMSKLTLFNTRQAYLHRLTVKAFRAFAANKSIRHL